MNLDNIDHLFGTSRNGQWDTMINHPFVAVCRSADVGTSVTQKEFPRARGQ
jgi:hypothetical protein